MAYLPRIVDQTLASRLASTGAVAIEGPKACGKTATAREMAASEIRLDVDPEARRAAVVDPRLILDGPTPRLIDEWQLEPTIWNHVRRTVDDRKQPGQFILTGSAVPADDATRHSGAGRMTRLRMRPMTLFEAGVSNGDISLADLLAGRGVRVSDTGLSVTDIAQHLGRGGWPGLRDMPLVDALQAVRDYLEEIRRTDVGAVDARRRDPEKIGRLLGSLARNVATHATIATLAGDVGGADGPLKEETAREYLDALSRLMIVEDQPAWGPHLRSKAVLRSKPKRHFVDPSLAVAALAATPSRLLRDLKLLGLLFESLVVRDLRVYAQANDARVLKYRDSKGLEADAIVETRDGRWAAFEVKLGSRLIDEGAACLKKLAQQVDTSVCGEPVALGVIVAGGYGYVREDGIAVIPIGALGP